MLRRSVLLVPLLLLPNVAHGQFVPVPPSERYLLADAIIKQLQGCWAIPDGFSGMSIKVSIVLAPDGQLRGAPDFSDNDDKLLAKSEMLVASIRRAAQRCAPFPAQNGDDDLPVRITFVVP